MLKIAKLKMGIVVINYFEIKQKGCGRGYECGKINATIFLYWLMRPGPYYRNNSTNTIIHNHDTTHECQHLRKLEVCF